MRRCLQKSCPRRSHNTLAVLLALERTQCHRQCTGFAPAAHLRCPASTVGSWIDPGRPGSSLVHTARSCTFVGSFCSWRRYLQGTECMPPRRCWAGTSLLHRSDMTSGSCSLGGNSPHCKADTGLLRYRSTCRCCTECTGSALPRVAGSRVDMPRTTTSLAQAALSPSGN